MNSSAVRIHAQSKAKAAEREYASESRMRWLISNSRGFPATTFVYKEASG